MKLCREIRRWFPRSLTAIHSYYDDHQGPMAMISWLQLINLISTADIWPRNRAEMVIMVEIKKLEATFMSRSRQTQKQ